MRRLVMFVLAHLVGLVVILGVVGALIGRDQLWQILGGPADQGPVAFETVERRSRPNDALMCPPGLCARAGADVLPAPVFALPPDELRRRLAAAVLAEGLAEPVGSDSATLQDRYVLRTPSLRFPDTLDTRVIAQGEGRATVALYSRSLIGYSDRGANRARIERILARIRS